MEDEAQYYDNGWADDDDNTAYAVNSNKHLNELQRLSAFQQVTTKVPPSYDGRGSWFTYEDAIDDWCDITELEKEKQEPALRNRLEGDAAIYKRLLDRERLKDANTGVQYFKSFLRPLFVKVYRFQQFMNIHRGNGDILRWMTRFQLSLQRMRDSWNDLYNPIKNVANPEVAAFLQGQGLTQEQFDELGADEVLRRVNERLLQAHARTIPISENLVALLFVALADLTQDQRQVLTSLMTHRNLSLSEYRLEQLRDIFLKIFCTTKTSVDNPLLAPSGLSGKRSFLVIEEGYLEDSYGFWCEDDDDGTEGFLDAYEDSFWVFDEENESWFQRRFQGRTVRKGKGKGKRRRKGGKAKGKGGRRFFRRKGKRSHYTAQDTSESWQTDNTWSDSTWWSNDNSWYEAWQGEWHQEGDEEYFAFKGKGKKGKGKKGKGKGHGKNGKDGDQQANMAEDTSKNQGQSTSSISNPTPTIGSTFFVIGCKTEELESPVPAEISNDFCCATHDEEESFVSTKVSRESSWTTEGKLESSVTAEESNEFSWTTNDDTLGYLVKEMQPTLAVLDLGCTRAMVSRQGHASFHGVCGPASTLWPVVQA